MKGEAENRVKALLAEGLSNKEICERLHLSNSGVHFHVGNLFRQYGLYGHADSRRLIVALVREMFALTDGAAVPTLPASAAGCSSSGREKKQHADDAAQL